MLATIQAGFSRTQRLCILHKAFIADHLRNSNRTKTGLHETALKWENRASNTAVLAIFHNVVINSSDKSNWSEDGLILAPSSRVQPIIAGNPSSRLQAPGYTAFPGRKQKIMNTWMHFSCFPLLHGLDPLSWAWHHPQLAYLATSVNRTKLIFYKHIQRSFSQVIW